MRFNLMQFSSAGKFFAGLIAGAILFSGSAIAYNEYVSDNTPENGYLLCANIKTKAVTFPNKLSCPSGTKALDMGAVEGMPGEDGTNGYNGRDGAPGKDGSQAKTYSAFLKSQDIIVTDSTNGKNVIVIKASNLVSAGTSYGSAYRFDASVDVNFPSSTTTSNSRWVYCAWRDSADWATTKLIFGVGDTARISSTIFTSDTLSVRMVNPVSTVRDIYLVCTFYGTGQISGGYITATETESIFKGELGP